MIVRSAGRVRCFWWSAISRQITWQYPPLVQFLVSSTHEFLSPTAAVRISSPASISQQTADFSSVVCYDIFVCPATLPAGLEQWTDGSKLTSLDRSSSRGDCALWRPRWVVVLTSLVSVVFVMFFTHYCCTLMHPHQLVQAHPTLMPSLCHSSNETAPSCSYSLVVIASHLIHHTCPN